MFADLKTELRISIHVGTIHSEKNFIELLSALMSSVIWLRLGSYLSHFAADDMGFQVTMAVSVPCKRAMAHNKRARNYSGTNKGEPYEKNI